MRNFNCRVPHTTHCLSTGDIMISVMGDNDDNGKCDFILVDSKSLKVKGELKFKLYIIKLIF